MNNTLRVLEQLSYINDGAMIDCTSEVKFEVERHIEALRSIPDYEIAAGHVVASRQKAEPRGLNVAWADDNDYQEGLSELSRTTRQRWGANC